MALQLGQFAAYGELWNTHRNSVCGWLGLMGMDIQIRLELTGNCESDLAGKHIRFRARAVPLATLDAKQVRTIQIRHIGPVGKMTLALRVSTDTEGNVLPPDLVDGDVPCDWKPLLNLEWFSQHGRTVVQMVDPVVEFVGSENDGAEAADAFFGALFEEQAGMPEEEDEFAHPSLQGQDPYCPGSDFEDLLAASERDEEVAKAMQETELMDDLIESKEEGESLVALLDGSAPLPDPNDLDENRAAYILRFILARLATCGVAIHMCEHVTALETYRIFREHMSPDAHCFRQLSGTGWVQSFLTSEYCPVCEEEFEREWQQRESEKAAEGSE